MQCWCFQTVCSYSLFYMLMSSFPCSLLFTLPPLLCPPSPPSPPFSNQDEGLTPLQSFAVITMSTVHSKATNLSLTTSRAWKLRRKSTRSRGWNLPAPPYFCLQLMVGWHMFSHYVVFVTPLNVVEIRFVTPALSVTVGWVGFEC